MKLKESQLRDIIQSIIKELINDDEEIDEVSQTADIAGYETPYAFTGRKDRNKERKKRIATQLGYELVHDLEDEDVEGNWYPIGGLKELKESKNKTGRQEFSNMSGKGSFSGVKDYDNRNRWIDEMVKKIEYKILRKLDPPTEKLEEGRRGKYHDYRDDDSKSTHKKLTDSLRQVRNKLGEAEEIIDMNLRLKSELEVDNRSYWKNANRAINKIKERILRIDQKMRKF